MSRRDASMVPRAVRVASVVRESSDVVTLGLDAPGFRFQPGQFDMLYAFGVGEVPISISGYDETSGTLLHTVRAVGAVSAALVALRVGDTVGVRGPFGSGFPRLDEGASERRIFVAGGLGLAPLRPSIREAVARDAEQVCVLVGARSPSELLFRDELASWSAAGADVRITVDHAPPGYEGHVGFVTALVDALVLAPAKAYARAFVCGPEIMMRAVSRSLARLGLRGECVHLSLERSMKCGIALCGHCQLGAEFLCKDGPVFPASRVEPLLAVREL